MHFQFIRIVFNTKVTNKQQTLPFLAVAVSENTCQLVLSLEIKQSYIAVVLPVVTCYHVKRESIMQQPVSKEQYSHYRIDKSGEAF